MQNLTQRIIGSQPCDRHATFLRMASRDVYYRTFQGGEVAHVSVSADGAIDLRIYDSEGRLVVSDTSLNHSPASTWVPRRAESFTVRVRNCEPFTVAYQIETN
jgi:hypothetical protein